MPTFPLSVAQQLRINLPPLLRYWHFKRWVLRISYFSLQLWGPLSFYYLCTCYLYVQYLYPHYMKHFYPTLLFLFLSFLHLPTHAQSSLPADAVQPNWLDEVPEVVFPDTGLVSLYYKTWQTAAGRVRRGPKGLPASPYLDENCYEDQIWIWDTCFMTLFSKYCPTAFPGKQSLLNLYAPLHDHQATPLRLSENSNLLIR